MTDSPQKILSLLQQLEAQLGQTNELTPDAKAQLAQALDDVREKLNSSPSPQSESSEAATESEDGQEASHHFSDRLQEMVQKFESSHPDLAAALDRVLTNLGQIGL